MPKPPAPVLRERILQRRNAESRHSKAPRSPPRHSKAPRSPPRHAKAPRSPTTPRTPPRRESFGPTDVFVSPVAESEHPTYEHDPQIVARILKYGDTMCRYGIKPAYIKAQIEDPTVALWFVRDAASRIFGFAFTKQRRNRTIDLKLICTHRRKGEGAALFRNILAYSRDPPQQIELEAVNTKVALIYAVEARRAGHAVVFEDHPGAVGWEPENLGPLKEALRGHRGMLPMRIIPPGYKAPARADSLSAKAYKAMMMQQHSDDSDSDASSG